MHLLYHSTKLIPSQIRDHAKMLLSRNGKSFADVIAVLDEHANNIEGDAGTEGATKRDIIGNLINYLDGC